MKKRLDIAVSLSVLTVCGALIYAMSTTYPADIPLLLPTPSALRMPTPTQGAAPSARTLQEIAQLPPTPPYKPRREIDPAWVMPHPVLTPLETRAAEAVEAVALRDGFAVRSVTCKRRGAWQICDLCYSHPLRFYGQIRVACNETRCDYGFGNDDPRSAGLNLNFCETH